MKEKNFNQRGFAALFITLVLLAISLSIAMSISVSAVNHKKASKNFTRSLQAYYAAEAGAEDILLRLRNGVNWSSPNILKVGSATTTTTVSDMIGGSRTVASQGNASDIIRKAQVVYDISADSVSFYYGAQIGDGGLEMGNNSRVRGNVFSNGSVIAPTGVGYIENSIVVAHNGNKISRLNVGGDARAHTCENSTITGDFTYVSGGSAQNCTAGGLIDSQPSEILPEDLPILAETLARWKTEAENGGVILGDYTVSGGSSVTLGPRKIAGNMVLNNNLTLVLTGTIWVTGNLTTNNGAIIRLDASYGGLGGVLIVDGNILVRPGVSLEGSGKAGSYLLLVSTSQSLTKDSPAIEIDNTTSGGIFYTTQGAITLKNNVQARQVTGYKIYLEQNAIVDYEFGLSDAAFSSGPGGSWRVASWREIE